MSSSPHVPPVTSVSPASAPVPGAAPAPPERPGRAQRPLWFALQGWRRRVVFVSCYEGLAIVCSSIGLAQMSGDGLGHAGVMGLASSAIAVLWNLIFNTLFERWEARQVVRGRSFRRRAAHALGFEGGLLLTFVPLFAWWFEVSLWQSLVMDVGLLVFFLLYTLVFNWVFDRLFGLPAGAAP